LRAAAPTAAEHLAPDPELIRTDWKQAVREAREFAGADGTVVITGSLYFISDARAWLLAEPGGGKSFPAGFLSQNMKIK
jgi:folylpolyglutamate synthase/dihydropteroate synthase